MANCPDCGSPLCVYKPKSSIYHEEICWNCGYYTSDSPAFKKRPEWFVRMVKENPNDFINTYLKLSDGILHEHKPDKDFTEPARGLCKVFIGFLTLQNLVG